MRHHLFCLTIDCDPDGLSGTTTDRTALSFDGLAALLNLPDLFAKPIGSSDASVPITWFIRVDSQLHERFGTGLYLLDQFAPFWGQALRYGHELGWHPHLYRQSRHRGELWPITDPNEATQELERLWEQVNESGVFGRSFRNGEGWHFSETFVFLERSGILNDSTAIPGRFGSIGHPMNWLSAPNQPYYPDSTDIRRPGRRRPLLELPMNTWHIQAPYDTEPRLRYMNPAVHEAVFADALDHWDGTENDNEDPLVWILICHPDELWSDRGPDLLYARCPETLYRNLTSMVEHIEEAGQSWEFTTVSEAGRRWREREGKPL